MAKITEQELRDYMVKNGATITNKEKIKIRLADEDVFTIEYKLEEDKEEGLKYELYDEVQGAKKFIEAYEINSLKDLAGISRSKLWWRYLQEKAEVIFTNGDDNSVNFRLFRNKTMVYSLDLNYYNEVMKVMNMAEHFKEYLQENWEVIEGMSYKW